MSFKIAPDEMAKLGALLSSCTLSSAKPASSAAVSTKPLQNKDHKTAAVSRAVLDSDDKVAEVVDRFKLLSDPSLGELAKQKVSVLQKYMPVLCDNPKGEVIFPGRRAKEHEKAKALKLCLDSFKACRGHMCSGDKNYQMALHYNAIVQLLFGELNFVNALIQFLCISIPGAEVENLLADYFDLKRVNGQLVNVVYEPDDLDDCEKFAFFLRFNKPLSTMDDPVEVERYLQSQMAMLGQFKASSKTHVAALLSELFTQLDERVRTKVVPKCDELSRQLLTMNSTFEEAAYFPHLLPMICPHFAYLIGCSTKQLYMDVDNLNGSGKADGSMLLKQKDAILRMLGGYLERQVKIYEHAFAKMQALTAADLKIDPDHNFENGLFDVKQKIPTAAQFAKEIEKLKKAIDVQLRAVKTKCCSQTEVLQDEKAPHHTETAASAPVKTVAPKKKKKKAKKSAAAVSVAPATAASAVEVAEKASSPATVQPVHMVPHLSFLTAKATYVPHACVRRWFTITPQTVLKIRDFEDSDKQSGAQTGAIIQKYKTMPEDELKLQLLLHGCAPLIDKIVNDPEAVKKYCYTTNTGLGMFVQVVQPDPASRPIKGVLFYGLGGNVYFHRKIDEFTMAKIRQCTLSQLVGDIARLVIQHMDKAPTEEERAALIQEFESGFKGDTVIQDKFEVLHFKDDRLKCQVRVFPLS